MGSPDAPRSLILLSDKSSGSTAFQYELLRHEDLWAVPFTPHNDHETLFWVKAAVLLGRPASDFYDGRKPFTRGLAERSLRELVARNAPGGYSGRTNEELVFEGFRAITRAKRGVFFEKSPHHLSHWGSLALLADYIGRYDDDVRIVLLTRNPLAVTYSAFNRWYSQPGERQYRWAQCYRNYLCLRELLPNTPFLEVRYEDFVDAPVATMERVARFADVEPDATMGSGIHARSLDAWARDETFGLELDPDVAALAEHLGYAPEELQNSATAPPPAVSIRNRVEFRARGLYGRVLRHHVRPALVAMGLREP